MAVVKPQPRMPVVAVSQDARDWAAIGIPVALAAVLCFTQISSRSLGFDEAATVTIASQHGSALYSAIAHDGGNMSGFYLLLHVLIGAFGNGLVVIRFPSALASVVTVALIGVIALRLFSRRAAFAAGSLAAVSLPLVFWGQNARGYAPMVAFVCAAYVAFIELADEEQGHDRKRRYWVAYVILMTLATLSSFVAVLVIPAQLVVLIRRRRIAGRFLLALAAYAICCVPLVLLALNRGSSQLFWVPRPTQKTEMQVLQALTSAGLEPSFHRTPSTSMLLLVTIVLVLIVALVIIWSALRGETSWGGLMIVAWFAVPVLVVWLASFVIQPLFLPRNLLMAAPPVALLLGVGLGDRRLPRGLAVFVLVALLAFRALQLGPSYGVSPEPWRQATSYVLNGARPGDCAAFYPADGQMAFQYYVGSGAANVSRAPRSILPLARWGLVRPFIEDYASLSPAQIAQRAAGCRRLWFVSSHEGQLDGPAQSLANHAHYLTLEARLQRVLGRAPIKQFGYASAIHVQLLPGPPVRVAASSRRTSAR